MSLAPLTHRRLATVNAAAMTIPAVLDALWAVVQPSVTTYSDGTARAFAGAGATGWTWARVQVLGVTEALYAIPAGGTMDQRVILAGRAVAPTPSPTMIAPDIFSANNLLISHQLNAGAFTTYNSATPFTNARFLGYTRLGSNVTAMTTIAVCVYETQETVWVELLQNGTIVSIACAGGMYDPETLAAAASETDGRRYGVVTTGQSTMPANFLGSSSVGTLWVAGTSNGSSHGYMWRPASNIVDVVARSWITTGAQTAQSMTTLAGEFPGQPLCMSSTSGWVGRVREVYWSRALLYHQRIDTTPGVIAAYAVAHSTTLATGDGLLLKY